ncbi:MAG: hypothetical protein OEM89_03245 [Nitrosopumilus sp.]|nr:hypothetical protein [Nitrosopumilus sp.]
MGKTVPSFRIALYQEEKKWKLFRATLDKKNKALFDDMFATARLYISACMMGCRPVRLESIFMAIIFHHFKQILSLGESN